MRTIFCMLLLAGVASAGDQPNYRALFGEESKPVAAKSDDSKQVPSGDVESVVLPVASGWVMNGGNASVGHVIAHGCPAWVANMYAGDPAMLNRIHSGFHERDRGGTYSLMKFSRNSVAAKPPASPVVRSSAPVASGCPGGVCPLRKRR